MILRINKGTKESPIWENVDAENAMLLNGLSVDDILNTAVFSSKSEVEEAREEIKQDIIRFIKIYDPSAWLTEDATTEDIVKYFVLK